MVVAITRDKHSELLLLYFLVVLSLVREPRHRLLRGPALVLTYPSPWLSCMRGGSPHWGPREKGFHDTVAH